MANCSLHVGFGLAQASVGFVHAFATAVSSCAQLPCCMQRCVLVSTPTTGSQTSGMRGVYTLVRTAFSVSDSLCELPSAAEGGFSDEGGSDVVIYGHNNELMSCFNTVSS